jgi:hypothetical protein
MKTCHVERNGDSRVNKRVNIKNNPGVNPTSAIYNASAVKIYNTTSM